MGSKRSKKSKQELELFPEINIEKEDMKKDETLEPEVNGTAIENNGVIPDVILKAPKRKKKNESMEEVPRKVKKSNDNGSVIKKVRAKKRKKSDILISENIENEQLPMICNIKDEITNNLGNEQLPVNGELKTEICENKEEKKSPKINNGEKKKKEITWPDEDIVELINRMDSNIPERDVLAYRSRVDKLNWSNVTFKNYTADDCKRTWLQVQKRIRRFRLLREVLHDAKEWVNTPKTNHKLPRPRKHPDMPRRPLSSYLLFYLKKKDEIISENPGLDGSDITKIVGQIYKNLPPETREVYEKLAATNREEYLEKLKIFFDKHPEYIPPQRLNYRIEKEKAAKLEKVKPGKVEKDKLAKVEKVKMLQSEKIIPKLEREKAVKVEKKIVTKLEKDKPVKAPRVKLKGERKPGRPPKSGSIDRPPKKCQTPFGLYYASEMKNMELGIEKSVFKEKCKEQYKQMADTKKVYWINMAEQDLIRYQDEVKAYKAKHPQFKAQKLRSILTKREKASKERASGKPVKPPNSAYALYSRVMLQSGEIKSVHPKDRMNYIANKWKGCTEEEQTSYRDQVVTLMGQYQQDYQRYVDTLPEEERRKILNQSKRKRGRAGRASRSSRTSGRLRKPRKRKPSSQLAKKVAPETKLLQSKSEQTNVKEPEKPKFMEPEQPPISACKYFISLYTGEGDAVQTWKALSADEKRKYEEELVKKKQAYILEFERFLKSLSQEELEAFSKSRQQAQSDEDESSVCSSDSDGDEDNVEEDNEGERQRNGNEDTTNNADEPHEFPSE